MPERHTQVLVVGGSLVGLSTSVLQAAAQAEKSLGVAVAVQPIARDSLPEPAEPAVSTAEAGWTGAALIRPDGVIAWKPDAPAADAAGRLATVLAGLLSRGAA